MYSIGYQEDFLDFPRNNEGVDEMFEEMHPEICELWLELQQESEPTEWVLMVAPDHPSGGGQITFVLRKEVLAILETTGSLPPAISDNLRRLTPQEGGIASFWTLVAWSDGQLFSHRYTLSVEVPGSTVLN